MEKEILALLTTKFAGVRKDGLALMAKFYATQVTTKEDAQALVEKLTQEQVTALVTDWRKEVDTEVTKGNKTYEQTLKTKFDFVEKAGEQTPPGTPPAPGSLTPEALRQMIAQAVENTIKPLTTELAAMKGSALLGTRKEQLTKAIETLSDSEKARTLKDFERMSFTDDQSFTDYLTETTQFIEKYGQEMADKGLSGTPRPLFGQPNKDGVSTGVQSFIDSKAKGDDNLKGREV